MDGRSRVALQIQSIVRRENVNIFIKYVDILLLEDFGKPAERERITGAIDSVILHFVDKEQRQHLYPLGEKHTLTLKMAADGFAYLFAAGSVFVNIADHCTLIENSTVK